MKIAPFMRAIEEHNARAQSSERRAESQKEAPDPETRSVLGSDGPISTLKSHPAALIDHILVHTGQHYDDRMSRAFFEALGIPDADINLGIGSGTHAEQVGKTMIAFETVVQEQQPDWIIVVGDVNATCACSITAKKEHVKLAHIEAGLRSRDLDMPEEINRLVTDRLSDLLFTPDRLSNDNLAAEGVPEEKIKFVGNIMIDTLEANRAKAEKLNLDDIISRNLLSTQDGRRLPALADDAYATMTMHRPSNVDAEETLVPIMRFLTDEVASRMPLIWPIHPRTRQRLESFGLWQEVVECQSLILLEPVGYHDMLRMNMGSRIMLTDSGGLQEECCVLGTPCLTMRWNTERPVTLQQHGGASVLVGNDIDSIRRHFKEALEQERSPVRPELWDGKTAERIVAALISAS